MIRTRHFLLLAILSAVPAFAEFADDVRAGLRQACGYFREQVALRGGYVYYYSTDLRGRLGEGDAGDSMVWVQPPGTPTVGTAFVQAYEATGDQYYLDAAIEAAGALRFGQLKSGGWAHAIDFDPTGKRAGQYRHGNGRPDGKNYSTLDDDVTQAALRFLMRLDRACKFTNEAVSEATRYGLDALLNAQFPNGGFPQVWSQPVEDRPITTAKFPDYDWRTERRIKEYWHLYTLNDNLAGDVAKTLILAHETYRDQRYFAALRNLGDFLLRAQMPAPQPAWCQQYHPDMAPSWARKFEPPAIVTSESQDVIEALLLIATATRDKRYLASIPRALDYLDTCLLKDGRLPRYLELKSNKPLYMYRTGKDYHLTYKDDRLPSHYSFKISPRLKKLRASYNHVIKTGQLKIDNPDPKKRADRAKAVLRQLDNQGRWLSTYDGRRLSGQPNFKPDAPYLSSATFAKNVATLCDYLGP